MNVWPDLITRACESPSDLMNASLSSPTFFCLTLTRASICCARPHYLIPGSVDGEERCMNVYDVRLEDDMPYCGLQWPPDLQNVTKYLAVRNTRAYSRVILIVLIFTGTANGCC